jgi:hypothetical protein
MSIALDEHGVLAKSGDGRTWPDVAADFLFRRAGRDIN